MKSMLRFKFLHSTTFLQIYLIIFALNIKYFSLNLTIIWLIDALKYNSKDLAVNFHYKIFIQKFNPW